MSIIKIPRSVIPACDVAELEKFEQIVEETAQIEKIGAYKIGFELALQYGLPKVVKTARKHTDKPIIYDHQKAGTDIPDTGKGFAAVCKKAKLDAAILFPQAGPETEKAWIIALKEAGIEVIVGGEMTHKGYLESESGYIQNEAPKRMYELAVTVGVKDFVVPGNKPEKITFYKSFLESKGIEPVFYSPGLIAQGGKISDSAKAAGKKWHAIIGRGIYEAPNIKKAALEFVKEI
ncbi:MAG TPA: orotidine 5'-phosphate decarboxylase / HUMPS family protein [archaeon]|nr:orotidine 5'-phosphate decarboxylase / HUMPS family protein [archaeon]